MLFRSSEHMYSLSDSSSQAIPDVDSNVPITAILHNETATVKDIPQEAVPNQTEQVLLSVQLVVERAVKPASVSVSLSLSESQCKLDVRPQTETISQHEIDSVNPPLSVSIPFLEPASLSESVAVSLSLSSTKSIHSAVPTSESLSGIVDEFESVPRVKDITGSCESPSPAVTLAPSCSPATSLAVPQLTSHHTTPITSPSSLILFVPPSASSSSAPQILNVEDSSPVSTSLQLAESSTISESLTTTVPPILSTLLSISSPASLRVTVPVPAKLVGFISRSKRFGTNHASTIKGSTSTSLSVNTSTSISTLTSIRTEEESPLETMITSKGPMRSAVGSVGSVKCQSKRSRDFVDPTDIESSNVRVDIKRIRVEGESTSGPRPMALITRALCDISPRLLAPTVVKGRNMIPDPQPNLIATSSSSRINSIVNNPVCVSNIRVEDGKRNDKSNGNKGGNRGDIICDFVKVKTNDNKSWGLKNDNDSIHKNRNNNQNDGNGNANANGSRSGNANNQGQGQGQGSGQRRKVESLNLGNSGNRRGKKGGR